MTITTIECTPGGGTTRPCRPTLFTTFQAFVRLSLLKRLLGRRYVYEEFHLRRPIPPRWKITINLTPLTLVAGTCTQGTRVACVIFSAYSRATSSSRIRHVDGGGSRAAGETPGDPRTTRRDAEGDRRCGRKTRGRCLEISSDAASYRGGVSGFCNGDAWMEAHSFPFGLEFPEWCRFYCLVC